MTRSGRALLLVALVAGAARAEDPGSWSPSSTFVLAASVVEWRDKAFAPFKDPRRDQAFVAQLKAAGVPAGNIVFLMDGQATLAAIRGELQALLARAGEGSTFLFYFQGHGVRRKEKTWLACYDMDAKDHATGFDIDEFSRVLDREWKGSHLLLVADCCHSGALGRIVERLDATPRVRAACFASAAASNTSTQRWTFTEALITALAGDGAVDRNRDGRIVFGEVERFVHDEMKFRENQLAWAKRTRNLKEGFVLRAVAPEHPAPPRVKGPWQVGDFLEACDREGNWYVAQILALRNGRCRVHFCGWDAKWDEWVGPEKLRTPMRQRLTVGERYEVEWRKGQWFLATVTKTAEDWFFFVHYEGEEGDDDEWVTANRVRPAPPGARPRPPEFAAAAPRVLAPGDVVAARWRREWYLATVTSIDAGVHAVRYADGDTGALSAVDLIPVAKDGEIREGERVLACWEGKPRMYAGTVRSRTAKGCIVEWEDGSRPSEVPLGKLACIRRP